MQIVFVVTNSKRKSLVFASEDLNIYSLEEAAQLTLDGKIDGAHVVKTNKSTYIRTNPSVVKKNEFDNLSFTIGNLLLFTQGYYLTEALPLPLKDFITLYRRNLKNKGELIKPVGQPEVLLISVKEKLQEHQNIIFDAAKKFDIDPYLLGAILIDEIARLVPFESITDKLFVFGIGKNTSIGIAQVRTDTANDIIKLGLYNPNPKDPKLPFKELNGAAREHLYTYLINPKHNIFFAAAQIRSIINFWIPKIDLTRRPEIIATLYPQGLGKPNTNPQSIPRGDQIAKEFYQLAKKWL